MKTTFSVLLFFVLFGCNYAVGENVAIDQLFRSLDSLLANEQEFHDQKVAKIADIKRAGKSAITLEERYWHNRRLYDEYFVFNADSAMRYVNENLAIAIALNNKDWENEWHINRSFILSVIGLLKDAYDELAKIDPKTLAPSSLVNYYSHRTYLYSHLGQLSGHRTEGLADYDEISHQYADSTFINISPDNPQYLWYKASAKLGSPDSSDEVMHELRQAIDTSDLDSRVDAMNAYILSRLYDEKGDRENRIRYLIYSGMADIKIANKDIASLEELSIILLDEGDIERAYRYINYCQQQALGLPNHVRASSLARIEARVHQLYVEEMRTTGRRLELSLVVLCIALALLVILTFVAVSRSRKLARSQHKERETNSQLNANIIELSKSREQQEKTLAELKEANEKINEINLALKEANYVKEECIGATFALCSTYIDKLDSFRKTISRMVRANMWNELRDEVSEPSVSNDELKQFYKSFDKLFLNIYPDFVKDFNNLLKPDEQIIVKPGELNTELRIYALVRLGINDSVKIAALLHCSPQTVYNNRLRVRNKAVIPKEDFAETVKSLGKFQN